MKIAILGFTATSYGRLTYLKNFLPQMAQLDASNLYEVFLPAERASDLEVRQPNFRIHLSRIVPRSGALRVLWEQLVLPWILWSKRTDAVYTAHNMAILLSPIPSIIAIQNVEPFFANKFPNALRLRPRLWLLRFLTVLSLHRSRKIIAVSEWERDFLVERFHLPHSKILVTYHGVTEGFHPPTQDSAAVLRERLGLEQPYILCVTRLAGYGNLLNLAKAYASLVKQGKVAMPLVVPGGVWDSRYMGRVRKLLAHEGCAGQVRFLGYVPHQHMPLLFGNAECFVFPSLLEACGNVLIEALACGTPILCCQRRPMTDICGDAAVFFDGEDPGDIADKISQVLSDRSLRDVLSRRGVARAAQFSWRQVAEKVHKVFEQLNPVSNAANSGAAAIHPERSP
ncbi:MAG: glycosyltransferase family 1 protein [Terriglobia bacterium]|jgi:glycosyltransferase involved in cell wall biosynthesis